MFRFIHIADVHLDAPVSARADRVRQQLRAAGHEALSAAAALVRQRQAHALLIAGDLFDGDRVSYAAEALVMRELGDLAPIPVIYVTGNHDPGGRGIHARTPAWPDNVTVIADPRPRAALVYDGDNLVGRVIGAGHDSYHVSDNLAASFPAPGDSLPHVGLLHTWVAGARTSDHGRYAPSGREDLRVSGYQYWALGHVHTCQQIAGLDAWYAGSLQGLSCRETGPHGALVVEVSGSGVRVDFVDLAPVCWAVLTIDDLQRVTGWSQLQAMIRERGAEAGIGAGSRQWMVRVVLTGACPLAGELGDEARLEDLERELARDFGALEVQLRTDVQPAVDVEQYRQGPHVLATALDLLNRAQGDNELVRELLPDDLALPMDREQRLEYVRELMRELEPELAARLVGGTGS